MGQRLPLRRRIPWRALLALPPLVFLALFFAWPVVAIVMRGLRPAGSWNLTVIVEVVRDPAIARVMWFTVWESVLSTLLCVLVGLPGAALFARFEFLGRRVLWALLLVPFVLPTVVAGLAFLTLIGPAGITGVELTGTIWAILIAHLFFNYAVVVRTVGAAWAGLGDSEVDAARTLGASPLRALLTITIPRLRSAVLAAASIVFLFSFTSFGIVMILGGVRQRTIEVEIYDQTARFLHLDVAAALSIMQLVGVILVLMLFGRARRPSVDGSVDRADTRPSRRPRTVGERAFVGANLLFMALFLGGPLTVLVVRSFSTSKGWGFDAYSTLGSSRRGSSSFVSPLDAVGNSLRFALVTMVISVLLGCCAAWALARPPRLLSGDSQLTRRPKNRLKIRPRSRLGGGRVFDSLTEGFLMIPLGTSAVTVGFGCLIALADPPLDFRSSWWMLPIAHSVIALPFVVRLLVPAVRSIDPKLREAAALLGAGRFRVWFTVDLPMIRRQIAVAAGFAFAVSLGEFGATSFLARASDVTVPIAIYRSLGRPGGDNLSQAMALSVILMAAVTVVIVVIDRLRPSTSAEF